MTSRNARTWLFGALLLLLGGLAQAQTPPSATLTVRWTNPTTTVLGGPLTGANALTKFQLWIGTAPVVTTGTPTVEINVANPLQTAYVHSAQPGQTLYVRMKACNAAGCSAQTAEASAVVQWPASAPGAPQNITIEVTFP